MRLRIYNTLARKKVKFVPIEPNKIRLYVCGMTVYDYCHIGHARVLVAFDVITRFLRATRWDVEYVRNITDIDDKILKRAEESGEDYTVLTERFIDAMHADEIELNVLKPDQEPRATKHMQDIIDMIAVLMDKKSAYQATNGDIYYRVDSFESYGQLSGKNTDELLSGARIGIDTAKEDPRDFALWKAAKAGEVCWQSPWGKGRPGWHIECSAMTKACLGNTFDIHGGGPDLPFPHHENEIAQSEAANGCKFVNFWMHAGAVRVDGDKMSKSLGNFFTIREVLKNYHPEVVRFLIISSHYRSAINYSEDNLVDSKSGLDRFYQTLKNYSDVVAVDDLLLTVDEAILATVEHQAVMIAFNEQFINSMNDDFNTPQALSVMFDMLRSVNTAAKVEIALAKLLVAQLKRMADILGLLQADPIIFLQGNSTATGLSADVIEAYIVERVDAKLAKNYARADEIRQLLIDQKIILEDFPTGTSWRRE
ncbi:MAG: cysteinyl-tRNA synthetase [Pseudohongiellaceae bacterium]|jgi:cysteinyl-tRNA synthetase